MTCIVGLKHDGKVYMGADSMMGDTNQYTNNVIANPKLFKSGEFIIGYTTSFRMGQILEHHFDPPKNTIKDNYRYMVRTVIEHIREIFNQRGFGGKENNKEWGGSFLMSYQGEIYEIQNDYSVLQYDLDYAVVGSGEYYAMGALYAGADFPPKMRIKQALLAAAKFSAYVCEPFIFLESD